ncbi:MAG: Ig-like domain-containing protein [bacterium]
MRALMTAGLFLFMASLVSCGDDDPTEPVSNAQPTDTTAPAAVADLRVSGLGSRSVTLAWTAPGDDGDTGTATAYELRRSGAAISAANWNAATPVEGLPAPVGAGGTQSFAVTGLVPGSGYHFALVAVDEADNRSELSPDLEAVTLGPPGIVAIAPPAGTTGLGMMATFTVTFDRAIDTATLIPANIDPAQRDFDLEILETADPLAFLIVPRPSLDPSSTATLAFTGGITDAEGAALVPQTFTFTTGPDDAAHWADGHEPNETCLTASPVDLDVLVTSLSTVVEDVDVYSFTLEEPLMVDARTYLKEVLPEPGDPDGNLSWNINFLRDEASFYSTRGASTSAGETESFHFSFLPGTYFVQIYGADDEVRAVYDLELVTSAPCVDDGYEDNDFRDEAILVEEGPLTGLHACYLDADWFKLEVVEGQTFGLDLSVPGYDSIMRVEIYEPGGGRINETLRNEDSFSGSLDVTRSGRLEIAIRFWQDDVVYDLDLTLAE